MLEPLGTITKYYPFLDEKTREVIEYVMGASENYRDFVVRLGEKVVSEDLPSVLAYLAIRHAYNLDLFETTDLIATKFGEINLIKPWVIASQRYRGGENILGKVFSATDDLISGDLRDWRIIETLNLRSNVLYADGLYKRSFEEANKGLEVIKDHPEFQFLESSFHSTNSFTQYMSAFFDLAEQSADKALEIARTFSDPYDEALAQQSLARVYKNIDSTKAIELITKATAVSSKMGAMNLEASCLNDLALTLTITGEFTHAHECLEKAYEIDLSMGVQSEVLLVNLARSHISLGEGQRALDLLSTASKSMYKKFHFLHFHMAEALILCNRLDDAADYIDSGNELVLTSGRGLTLYYTTRSLLERERGDFKSAIRSLKSALRRTKKFTFHIVRVRTRYIETLALAFFETNDAKYFEETLVSLSRLEQFANEQNFFAVLAKVEILRGIIHSSRGSNETARKHLKRALELTQSSSMTSLRTDAESLLSHLESEISHSDLIDKFKQQIRTVAVPTTPVKEIPFNVLGCIVMLRDGGIEIYSKYISDKLTSDPSMVAGLISAVSTFTSALHEDTQGELQSIVHQDIAVLLEHGVYVTCAFLSSKDTYDARVIQRRFLEKFEEDYSESLIKFDGGIAVFRDADGIFDEMFY
ncbi:MAG: tetratricopeptide repeat protein [Candidatus Thorarchaeota archaeon]